MDATSIARYLFLGAGLPFLLLGSVHGVLPLRGTRRPRLEPELAAPVL